MVKQAHKEEPQSESNSAFRVVGQGRLLVTAHPAVRQLAIGGLTHAGMRPTVMVAVEDLDQLIQTLIDLRPVLGLQ